MFVAGRVLGGLSCGLIFAICPTYAAKVSPPNIRGGVVMIYALNMSTGYFVTEWLGLGFYFIPGEASWQVLFGLQSIPTFAMLGSSFFMPESPRWLVFRDRYDDNLVVLRRIHESVNDGVDFHQRGFPQMKAQIEMDKREQPGIKDNFQRPSNGKRVLLVICFTLFQQLTGIIPLQYYQVIIYGIAGLDKVLTLVMISVWATCIIVPVLAMSSWVDRIGRQKAMFLAYAFIITGGLRTVNTGARFEAAGSKDVALGSGIIVGMFLLVFGYGTMLNTFAPTGRWGILWVCHLNIVVIVLVQVTPLAIEHISWRYFLIFVICNFIFIIGFFLFYPEPKGKTLKKIEAVFGDKIAETLEEVDENMRTEKSELGIERKEVVYC